MLRLVLLAVFALAFPAASMAARTVPQPVPVPVPTPLVPVQIGEEHAGSCEEIYLNETTFTGYFSPAGAPGVEIGDDLHTRATADWPLCAFDFAYYGATGAAVQAIVTFYRNDGGDGGIGPVIAGPFLINGLPGGGPHAVHIEVPSGIVGPDVWFGILFNDSINTGLMTFDPATIGFTHDRDIWAGGIYDSPYGGVPPASYYIGVYASPPTGTHESTWGQVKSIYR